MLGLVVFTPFARWRHDHALHHATAGDLDRRGNGDIKTLTVSEYDAQSWRGRLAYRLFRNPVVMFGVGPLWGMLISPRWVRRSARPAIHRSVWGTNLALAIMIGGMCWLIGWRAFRAHPRARAHLARRCDRHLALLCATPVRSHALGTLAGVELHRRRAPAGSSYLRLPKVLQFFTGNIGLHHVHHLSTKIPNYNLRRAHDGAAIFGEVSEVSLWDGLRAVRLKLWDVDTARLVTWKEHRRAVRSVSASSPVKPRLTAERDRWGDYRRRVCFVTPGSPGGAMAVEGFLPAE